MGDGSVQKQVLLLRRLICAFQEHLNYVTEISQDELYVLDPELVITQTVGTSPAMPDLVDSSATPTGHLFAFPSSSSTPPSSPAPR